MLRIAVKTLGCKANRYESDRLFDELGTAAAIVEDNEMADLIVVNTCTVTHVADRKSRQIVVQLKNAHPNAKVVVFGCGARTSRDQYMELELVDYIARDRHDLRDFILKQKPNELTHDGMYFSSANVDAERTRSLIKIQDGCDRFCSYCIIPIARGMPKSFASKEILNEIKEKERKGYKEIVITGINIGDWTEGNMDFGDLLELILSETEIPRIRISSIEPCDFSDKFYEIMSEPRICKHLHLCLQAGSDKILEDMGRNYDTKSFMEICDRLKKSVPDIAITTDMITGFPGETEEEFKKGYDFAKKMGFSKIHVFPYSKRSNTPAAKRVDQVPYIKKKEWSKRLIQLSKELEEDFKKQFIGKVFQVLFEDRDSSGRWQGYSDNYVRIAIKSNEKLSNQIRKIKIIGLESYQLAKGELV